MPLLTRSKEWVRDRLRDAQRQSCQVNYNGTEWNCLAEALVRSSNIVSVHAAALPSTLKDLLWFPDRALASYAKLTKNLSPASHSDISAYRTWISEHAPVVEQEAAFLQQGCDLIAVTPQCVNLTKPNTSFRTGSALETPVIVVAFGLLSTIIVFKVVPQILARLVISAMVGIAALCTLSPEVMTNVMCVRDWTKAIAT